VLIVPAEWIASQHDASPEGRGALDEIPVGTMVRVVRGAFVEHVGRVEMATAARARLLLECFGRREISVTFAASDVSGVFAGRQSTSGNLASVGLSRIVGGVNVGDPGRPDAVVLDDRFLRGPGVMMHALRHVEIAAGS